MVRTYQSSWNWCVQDAVQLFYQCMLRQHDWDDAWGLQLRRSLVNRANTRLLNVVKHLSQGGANNKNNSLDWRVQQGAVALASDIEAHLTKPPMYVPCCEFQAPLVTIDPSGVVTYKEIPRPNVANAQDYVRSISAQESKEVTRLNRYCSMVLLHVMLLHVILLRMQLHANYCSCCM